MSPVLEAISLLVSPLVAFYAMGVREMMRPNMIDPYFYGGFAQQGSEMLARFGTENYFWVRVGFILPARAFTMAFGPVGGFYAFRYVLVLVAVVPAYLLFRLLVGRAAGAVAVAALLTSPVIWHAWGTDYPDASAVSYLTASTALIVMPARSRLLRTALVVGSAAFAAFAVHSQLMAAPIVAGILGGWFLVTVWRARRGAVAHAVMEGLLVLFTTVVVTGLLMLASDVVLGSGDLFTPTEKAIERLQTPEERAKWNSDGVGWVFRNTYLFVLPAVVAGWAVLVTRRSSRRGLGAHARAQEPSSDTAAPTRVETAVVAGTALTGLGYAYLQFGRDGSTLDYFLYSSMLWPGICLTTAFVVVRLAQRLAPAERGVSAAAALIVVVAAALSWPIDMPTFDMFPVGWLLVAAIVLGCLVVRHGLRGRGAAMPLLLVLASAFALTVGKPSERPLVPGQVPLPPVHYDDVLATDGSAELDDFRVAARLPEVVGDPRFSGDLLMTWAPPDESAVVAQAAAQYLWMEFALPYDLPDLSKEDADYLYSRKPRHLVFLGSSDAAFQDGVAALRPYGLGAEVVRKELLRSGDSVLHVWVVRLATYDGSPPA